MTVRNLTHRMAQSDNVVDMLRNSQIGMYVYPVVAPEFTNWRDEQRAWRENVVLFDQTHHMDELVVEGKDAAEFLEGLAINSFSGFELSRAKHYVPVSTEGYVIGDMIIFRLREDKFLLVGRAPTANWIEFNHAISDYNVRLAHDPRSPSRPEGKSVTRIHYRYQLQGPDATRLLEYINGGRLPDIRFFHVDKIQVGSREVMALRHGMAGVPGLEIWGPYEDKPYILSMILQAAKNIGANLHRVGSRAYSTNTLESGWIPSPLPAIYTGNGLMKQYRDWLSEDSYEATCSLGGSYVSDDISDYYTNPYDLGYGFYINNDHEFIGKDALAKMKEAPSRKKVTLEWNSEDVIEIVASAFRPGMSHYKWIDFPQSNYASSSFDSLLDGNKHVGLSMFTGYSYNERCMLSLGIVNSDIDINDELTLHWGEPDGGTAKTSCESHDQTRIRVRVSPVPYSRDARLHYADSWRTQGIV